MIKIIKKISIYLLFISFTLLPCDAQIQAPGVPQGFYVITNNVVLAWNPNTDNPDGYKLYVGPKSQSYNNIVDLGKVNSYAISGLIPGSYFFAVTAYNNISESGKSNEVSAIVALTQTDPYFVYIITSTIETTYAIITWVTSVDCSGVAMYSLNGTNWFATVSNNLGTTDHLSKFTGLLTRTHYLYKVQSVCNGKTIESVVRSFNTK